MLKHIAGALVCLALAAGARAETRPPAPSAAEIEAACQAARPRPQELALYELDWVEGIPKAIERTRRERRPLLVLVVRNISGGGNLLTGHC